MDKTYFDQPTVEVAKRLLGQLLVHRSPEGLTSGIIVETEAYLGLNDPASHAYRGQTPRNSPMFGPGGHAYVYFTYGMHYCFNVVTDYPGEAVLIRALEPVEGISLMKARRELDDLNRLCKGPACVVKAMGITKEYNGISLAGEPLTIESTDVMPPISISKRIGISKAIDEPLRFYISGNPFVSKLKASRK